ncbi:MAG: hypothetical protein JSV86_03515 [Gemmatimonadota bacterium]|nr:MAG: hypothetical protein JSV86_03515 [Gemmatimonadota bacterium]
MKFHKLFVALSFSALVVGCNEQDVPTEALTTPAEATFDYTNNPKAMPVNTLGDCSAATIIDPGELKRVDGLVIIQGRVFDCPLSGDLEGTTRVMWHNAVFHEFGTPNAHGHVTGTTILLVDVFYGQTDLNGTFEGPFSSTLQNLLFGESKSIRYGTGDFQGLVMHSTFYQDPPASQRTINTGTIIGR